MTTNGRRKGHNFEREMARHFRGIFGDDRVRRGLQYRDGAECADVITPFLWVECKRGKQTNPRAALAQAVEASVGQGYYPVAVCKDDWAEPFVVMQLEDFSDLVRQLWGYMRQ